MKNPHPSRHMTQTFSGKQAGFTLIETMVALTIAAIVLTLAVPGFRNMIQDNHIATNAHRLVTSLALARSESVRRGTPVSICPSNDSQICTDSEWEDGWIVFTDNGSIGSVDGSDEVLRIQQSISGGVTVSLDFDTPYIRYQPTGAIAGYCESCKTPKRETLLAYDIHFNQSLLSHLVLAVLPGNNAMASSGSSGSSSGSSGSSSGNSGSSSGNSGSSSGNSGSSSGNSGSSGSGSANISEFDVCDKTREDETGIRVGIAGVGRTSTQKIKCD